MCTVRPTCVLAGEPAYDATSFARIFPRAKMLGFYAGNPNPNPDPNPNANANPNPNAHASPDPDPNPNQVLPLAVQSMSSSDLMYIGGLLLAEP